MCMDFLFFLFHKLRKTMNVVKSFKDDQYEARPRPAHPLIFPKLFLRPFSQKRKFLFLLSVVQFSFSIKRFWDFWLLPIFWFFLCFAFVKVVPPPPPPASNTFPNLGTFSLLQTNEMRFPCLFSHFSFSIWKQGGYDFGSRSQILWVTCASHAGVSDADCPPHLSWTYLAIHPVPMATQNQRV